MTKSNLTVRIPDELQERLRELAKQTGKSLNKTAEEAISTGIHRLNDARLWKELISDNN